MVLIAPSAANYKGAVLAVICIVIGAAIYALNITDPQNPATPRQRVMGAGFALANSIQLFAATYGVTGLVAQAAAK